MWCIRIRSISLLRSLSRLVCAPPSRLLKHFPAITETMHAAAQDTLKALSEEVDEELIPVVYGGSNALPLYESPQEIELRTLVDRLNS